MTLTLSLQGSMAVGKTTALRQLEKIAPQIHVSYESVDDVVAEVKRQKLQKNRQIDYLAIQKLWINQEVKRWQSVQDFPVSIMDFGAEEIEFYTLNYPLTIAKDWDIEAALHDELVSLRQCLPQRILYLDADDQTLRRRKDNDQTRSREFFDYYLEQLLPLKRNWFLKRTNVDWLDVTQLSQQEVAQAVAKWVTQQTNEKVN